MNVLLQNHFTAVDSLLWCWVRIHIRLLSRCEKYHFFIACRDWPECPLWSFYVVPPSAPGCARTRKKNGKPWIWSAVALSEAPRTFQVPKQPGKA